MKNRFEVQDCVKFFRERGYVCAAKETDGDYAVVITMMGEQGETTLELPLTAEQVSKRAKEYRESKLQP